MNFKKILACVAATAVLSSGSAAFAESDLVFKHNSSWYHVYTNLEVCKGDHQYNSNTCAAFVNKKYCGINMYSTTSASNVAKDRLKRNQNVRVRTNDSAGRQVCNITP